MDCKVSLSNNEVCKRVLNELRELVEDGLSKGLEGASLMICEGVTDVINERLLVNDVKPMKGVKGVKGAKPVKPVKGATAVKGLETSAT